MPERSPKRPRDVNQLGKLIVDLATGQASEVRLDDGKDPAAVSLGRRGGLKGGPARAAKLTAAQRQASARKAARARWAKPATKAARPMVLSPDPSPRRDSAQPGA